MNGLGRAVGGFTEPFGCPAGRSGEQYGQAGGMKDRHERTDERRFSDARSARDGHGSRFEGQIDGPPLRVIQADAALLFRDADGLVRVDVGPCRPCVRERGQR